MKGITLDIHQTDEQDSVVKGNKIIKLSGKWMT